MWYFVLLNSSHCGYYGYGVSPVDDSLGVTTWRLYGGVGFMRKKHLGASTSIIECEFDWLCGIKICDGKKNILWIWMYVYRTSAMTTRMVIMTV